MWPFGVLLMINPTEQPMATSNAGDLLARLEALGSSLASNRLALQTAALAMATLLCMVAGYAP